MVGRRMKAKKRFGQNFLIDNTYINRIIDSINVFSNDLIIEIGPGQGALTKRLKTKDCELIAYEIDEELKPILDSLIDASTHIYYQDFLTVQNIATSKEIVIVGNLPYYITTPILEHIIKLNLNPKEVIIMVQKEVADRFLAREHTKEYGYFTLWLKYFFEMERICDVPPKAFNPAPKVMSTVLKLKRRENKPQIDINKYQQLLKDSFKQKRKKLKNNLTNYDWSKIKEILTLNNLSEDVRAEELKEEIFIEIVNKL